MREKYVIACSDEQKKKNYKYIYKKYEKDKKNNSGKKRRGWMKEIIPLLQFLRISESYYFYDEKLCGLYIEELELFYLNSNFDKRRLQVRKAYLTKNNERYYGIFLPIFLSLFASVIYGICTDVFFKKLSDIFKVVGNTSLIFFDLISKNAEYECIDICKAYSQLIIYVFFFTLIFIILVGYVVIKIVHVITAFIGGFNFSKITIKQYEIDYLDRLESNEEYFSLTKEIDRYSDKFFDVINLLAYNMIIKDGYVSVENVIYELGKKLCTNPIIVHNNKFSTVLFEKDTIVKSIICRVLLKMKEKNSCLLLKKNRIFLKKAS